MNSAHPSPLSFFRIKLLAIEDSAVVCKFYFCFFLVECYAASFDYIELFINS